jgi:hypothetical protein
MMWVVACFLVLNGTLAVRILYGHWSQRRAQAAPPARRLTGPELLSFGVRQLLFAAVLAFTFVQGQWTLQSVGISSSRHWLDSVLAGELAFLGLALGYTLIIKLVGLIPAMRLAATRGNLRAWPRKRSHKIFACIFIMGFNPFIEELVMRGVLIHQWGLLLESAVIPILVGFALNALFHWYQGWRMQLWHALYFWVAVALLYSPWGMVAAITAHVFGDVFPFVTLRRNLLRARNEQRKARAARAARIP